MQAYILKDLKKRARTSLILRERSLKGFHTGYLISGFLTVVIDIIAKIRRRSHVKNMFLERLPGKVCTQASEAVCELKAEFN